MCLLVSPIVTDMVKDTYLTGGLENVANQTDENFIGKQQASQYPCLSKIKNKV